MANKSLIVNYLLNKFCPFILGALLIFSHFEFDDWRAYVIIAMMVYIDRFSFKTGYSVAYCESKGITTEFDD